MALTGSGIAVLLILKSEDCDELSEWLKGLKRRFKPSSTDAPITSSIFSNTAAMIIPRSVN
jgi:hypothetical protein